MGTLWGWCERVSKHSRGYCHYYYTHTRYCVYLCVYDIYLGRLVYTIDGTHNRMRAYITRMIHVHLLIGFQKILQTKKTEKTKLCTNRKTWKQKIENLYGGGIGYHVVCLKKYVNTQVYITYYIMVTHPGRAYRRSVITPERAAACSGFPKASSSSRSADN